MVGGPTNAGYIQKHAACGCLTAVHVTSMHHPSLSVASEPHHKLQAVREGRYGKGTNTAHMHINKKTCCTAQHVTVSQLCMLHSTPRITQPRSERGPFHLCHTNTNCRWRGGWEGGGQGEGGPIQHTSTIPKHVVQRSMWVSHSCVRYIPCSTHPISSVLHQHKLQVVAAEKGV